VADSLGDLQMAVRADPSFIVIGICSNAGLSRVGNASSEFPRGVCPFSALRNQSPQAPFVAFLALIALGDYCAALVPANPVGVSQGAAWRTVSTLDVLHAPANLSFWIG
jgi:hypothetical protein